MAGFQVNHEALDACAKEAATQAGNLGGAGEGFGKDIPSHIYGEVGPLPGVTTSATGLTSTRLAGAVRDLEETAARELGAARSLLGAVERAVEAVAASVRAADGAAAPAGTPR